ncbi:MFS transporter [Streptomyces spiralis]
MAGGSDSIAGQVLGGLLLRLDLLGLGWRMVFLVNVPVGIAAFLLAARLLPRIAPSRQAALDLPGAAGIAGTVALLLIPLTLGRTISWPLWTWCAMAAAIPTAWLTLRRQRRLTDTGNGRSILDLALFRITSFTSSLAAGAAFMAYFASFMFTLTLFLQAGLHLNAFGARLAFAPMGTAFGVTALLGSQFTARFGPRVIVLGTAVTATGLVLLAVIGVRVLPAAIGALILVGAGNGLVLPQLIGAALSGVAAHHAGVGSALLPTTQQFAGSAGVTVIGSVFFATLGADDGGYPLAMQRCAFIALALLIAVAALVAHATRRSPTPPQLKHSAARIATNCGREREDER